MPDIPTMSVEEAKRAFSMASSSPTSNQAKELLSALATRQDWASDTSIRRFAYRFLAARLSKTAGETETGAFRGALKTLIANSHHNKDDGLSNLIGKDPSKTVEAMIVLTDGASSTLCANVLLPFSQKSFGPDVGKKNEIVNAMIRMGETPYGQWDNEYSGALLSGQAETEGWKGVYGQLLEKMNTFPVTYAIPFIKTPWAPAKLKNRAMEIIGHKVTTAQGFHLLLDSQDPDDRPGSAYSFMINPTIPFEEKKRLYMLYSIPSHQDDPDVQAVHSAIFTALAKSDMKPMYEIALKDFIDDPKYATVGLITENLDLAIEYSDRIWPVIQRDPDLLRGADQNFMAFMTTMQQGTDPVYVEDYKTSNWYGKHLVVEANVFEWKNLSETGQAAFMTFVLLALGIPMGSALMGTGISGSQLAANKNLARPAAEIVRMKDADPEYQMIVDQAIQKAHGAKPKPKDYFSDDIDTPQFEPSPQPSKELSEAWKRLEPQNLSTKVVPENAAKGKATVSKWEADLIVQRSDFYTYLHERMGEKEFGIISQVADEEGLDPLQKKLLLAIRIIENGRPGKEMGQGDYQPTPQELKAMWASVERENGPWTGSSSAKLKHPARRYEGDFDQSLRLQAQWAAGTVKKHFDGSVASFAQRYCRGNWLTWFRLAKDFLLSTDVREA